MMCNNQPALDYCYEFSEINNFLIFFFFYSFFCVTVCLPKPPLEIQQHKKKFRKIWETKIWMNKICKYGNKARLKEQN